VRQVSKGALYRKLSSLSNKALIGLRNLAFGVFAHDYFEAKHGSVLFCETGSDAVNVAKKAADGCFFDC
jgi:hypothetical protein